LWTRKHVANQPIYVAFKNSINNSILIFWHRATSAVNGNDNDRRDKGLIIHISASKLRLLEIADEIGFTKQTRHGMRNFNIGCVDDFIYDGT